MIDAEVNRAAVMAWRDEATLSAIALINKAAAEAMRTLDRRLEAIPNVAALIKADIIARDAVRPAMRISLGGLADQWFTAQASGLRSVDERLAPVVRQFALQDTRPALPEDDQPSAATRFAGVLRFSIDGVTAVDRALSPTSPLRRLRWIHHSIDRLSARAGYALGESSGIHDQVRAAGRRELTSFWLGPTTTDVKLRPYLSLLIDSVDRAARDAMEMLA